MKAVIALWAGEGLAQLKTAGYRAGEEIDESRVWEVAQDLFKTGLNVMVYHGTFQIGPSIILFVDTQRFQQR
jgi:hypothetical protein